MPRKASSKPDSGSAQSSATIGFDMSAAKNMAPLPGELFYSTKIPFGLWFLAKNKNVDAKRGSRDRLEVDNQLALAA